jgi:PTS system ascorbate-specific IIB component
MKKRLHVVAVCGFGIGTSLIMRITIEKVLQDMGMAADVENADIMTAASLTADLIYTSQEFCDQLACGGNAAVIVIHNILSYDEIKEKTQKAMSASLDGAVEAQPGVSALE